MLRRFKKPTRNLFFAKKHFHRILSAKSNNFQFCTPDVANTITFAAAVRWNSTSVSSTMPAVNPTPTVTSSSAGPDVSGSVLSSKDISGGVGSSQSKVASTAGTPAGASSSSLSDASKKMSSDHHKKEVSPIVKPATTTISAGVSKNTKSQNPASSSTEMHQPLDPNSLVSRDLKVSAFSADLSMTTPVAEGRITSQIASNIYTVVFDGMTPSITMVMELGSRIVLRTAQLRYYSYNTAPVAGPGSTNTELGGQFSNTDGGTTSGLVAKVHPNGTYAVLLDNDIYLPFVPKENIVTSEGKPKFISSESYRKVQDWVRAAGVLKRSEQESTATILFQRGWRAETLYLLEAQDVHCLFHLNKSVRMGLLEQSHWELEKHHQQRDFIKERIKEKEWRYLVTKYSGVASAMVGLFAMTNIFLWNFKNYQKQTRAFQLSVAVDTLTNKNTKKSSFLKNSPQIIHREAETEKLRHLVEKMDIAHPRITVLTGQKGVGKTTLACEAGNRCARRTLIVSIRSGDDPVRALAKSLGVTNIDVCGDLLDFVTDAYREAAKSRPHAKLPLLIFNLLEGAKVYTVYNLAVALSCERHVCHAIVEIDAEKVDFSTTMLPRVDLYYLSPFTPTEAETYVGRKVDPVGLHHFISECGTNPHVLDQLISAVCQRDMEPLKFTEHLLARAMKDLKLILENVSSPINREKLKLFLKDLAEGEFSSGLKTTAPIEAILPENGHQIVFYNHEAERWMFTGKVYYTAVNCMLM